MSRWHGPYREGLLFYGDGQANSYHGKWLDREFGEVCEFLKTDYSLSTLETPENRSEETGGGFY